MISRWRSEREAVGLGAGGDPLPLGELVPAALRAEPAADFGIAFGGFKQSGIGREGGTEGLLPFLETKTVILEGRPTGYEDTEL